MPFLFSLPMILWKLGLVLTFIAIPLVLFEVLYPSVLSWLRYLAWFVFLDTTMYIGIGQMAGRLYAYIRFSFKLPSKGTHRGVRGWPGV